MLKVDLLCGERDREREGAKKKTVTDEKHGCWEKKKTAPKLRGEQKEREKKNIKVSQLKPSRDSSLYFH